jgi:ABC-type amino acid transport substrate-binding protein
MGSRLCGLIVALAWGLALWLPAARADLAELRRAGELRHLGIPYANFVTGFGDGMDVELMRGFAAHLGLTYRYVRSDWPDVIGDLTGRRVRAREGVAEVLGSVPVRGDVIATGMTVLDWRATVVAFGEATFPTQVWLVARADSPVRPILPSGTLTEDIGLTKRLLGRRTLLGKANTCLDPALYGLGGEADRVTLFDGTLNELAPALLNAEAEMTLLDVPDALVALQKWPGRLKVLGPVSGEQRMAPAFRPEDRELRAEFNRYLAAMQGDGRFAALVRKYYPFVTEYFPGFLPAAH